MKCNQSHRGFELVSSCPFPTMITITPHFTELPKLETPHQIQFPGLPRISLFMEVSLFSRGIVTLTTSEKVCGVVKLCFILTKYCKIFGLIGLHGISTIVGYLKPNPLYTYISSIYMILNKFCRSHS